MNINKIYRYFITITFLIAFVAQSFSKAFVVADYYINTSKYEKNCENKARPQMHCNGKCQMIKRLKEEDKKDQQNPDGKADHRNGITLSSRSFFLATLSPAFTTIKSESTTHYSAGESINCIHGIFHPPQFL